MSCSKTITVVVLSLVVAASGSHTAERLDFEKLLTTPGALQKFAVEYEAGDAPAVFVFGTGAVARQMRATLPLDTPLPTCRGLISTAEVKDLVRTMMRERFFELPVSSYVFATVSKDEDEFWKVVDLHTIMVTDGEALAARQFAAGVYYGKKQKIPPRFAAVEEQLKDIVESALKGKACHLAPRIELPSSISPSTTAVRRRHL